MPARPYPWKRPRGWSLRKPRLLLFQLREAGGVLSAIVGLILLYQIIQLQAGPDAYAAFLAMVTSLPMLLLLGVLFVLVMVHAVTWFILLGKAQPIQFTAKPMSWKKVFVINALLWVVVSGAVFYIVFGGP